jgi:hypothetical protein
MLNDYGFERHNILMESGSKMAMFSGRMIYVIGQLQLPGRSAGDQAIGSVPFSMKGVVASSVWHYQQEDNGNPVKAVNPLRKEQDR